MAPKSKKIKAKKISWVEQAWEEFLIKFWDALPDGVDTVEYTKEDLLPILAKYKKSGQGEIRIFHYGHGRIDAVKKRNVAKIPITRQRWKLIKRAPQIEFKEPQEKEVYSPRNKLTSGMIAGVQNTLNHATNPGETTLLAIANHSGIIADFYGLAEQGVLFTGGRQSAGIHLVVNNRNIDMTKALIEIDGGFEWPHTIVIVEMKSSFKQRDFDINQALIPMLKWENLLKDKKVHSLVLLAQTNKSGIEYWAYDLAHKKQALNNEMRIVRSKKYILEIK